MNQPQPSVVIRPAGPETHGLPAYVEHGGEIVCRHPADALDIRLYGFTIEADGDRLDEWCDRCLNAPTGGEQHWRAAGHHVLLNFVDIPKMGSTDPLDRWLGVTPEHETAIWLPVYDLRHRRAAWAIPYMFVDSGMAMAGGRETYGFPKQLGNMRIPREDKAPELLGVDTVTMRKFGPDEEAVRSTVVTARRLDPPVALDAAWDHPLGIAADMASLAFDRQFDRPDGDGGVDLDLRDIVAEFLEFLRSPLEHLEEMVGDAVVTGLLARHLLEKSVPMVLLKQIRDAVLPGAACYQAIIEVANEVTAFRGGGFLPDYEVMFAEWAGEPIVRELGIRPVQVPHVGFWLEFDFLVHLGTVLWEAGATRH